jgi:hypothetical protein
MCNVWRSGRPSKWAVSTRPLEFFLCGHAKDKVHATKVTEVEDLKTRIGDVVPAGSRGMLACTCEGPEFRLDVVSATLGDHVELR